MHVGAVTDLKKVHPHLFRRFFFFYRLGCFTEVSDVSIDFNRLTALCFLSVSHAQLMRRAESHGRRGSRLQGALREALAKVTAEQVLFVEENFLGKNWWWVMSGDAKWFANIKGVIFLDAHVVAKFEPFTLKEVKCLVFRGKLSLGIFDEAISNHRCFDDFVWKGESHECEQVNHTMKMTSMWVHVGELIPVPLGRQDSFFIMTFFPRWSLLVPQFRNHVDPRKLFRNSLNKFEALNAWKSSDLPRRRAFVTATRPFPKMPRAIFLLTKRYLPWPGPILPRWVSGEDRGVRWEKTWHDLMEFSLNTQDFLGK